MQYNGYRFSNETYCVKVEWVEFKMHTKGMHTVSKITPIGLSK